MRGLFQMFCEAQDKRLVLMRGVSGTGKSTKARSLVGNGVILSTDDFWGENYDFDPTRIAEAHQWNQERAREAMKKGISPVVIDNTNIQLWEPKPYVQMAQEYGYEVQIEEPDSPAWGRVKEVNQLLRHLAADLEQLNQHGVPADVIMKMISQYGPMDTDSIMASKSPWEVETNDE